MKIRNQSTASMREINYRYLNRMAGTQTGNGPGKAAQKETGCVRCPQLKMRGEKRIPQRKKKQRKQER